MDFGALPPEINSARMYSGPGSAPLLAAASAWAGLAEELHSAAVSYASVVSALAGDMWLGPASASMAAAAAPFAAWMSAAAQAEQTAAQAEAAAAAYAAAFVATVPPPLIVANRAQLMALIATNFLGQNTPAIAATEAHYVEMWAQDAAAMYAYAGSSATATQLTPFNQPQQSTNAGGPAAQSAAISQAATTLAGSGQSVVSQLMSAVPGALQGLASPTASGSGLDGILDALGFDTLSSSSGSSSTGLSGTAQHDLRVERFGSRAASECQHLEHHLLVGFLHAEQLPGQRGRLHGSGWPSRRGRRQRDGRPGRRRAGRFAGQSRGVGQLRIRKHGQGSPDRSAIGTTKLDRGRASAQPSRLGARRYTDDRAAGGRDGDARDAAGQFCGPGFRPRGAPVRIPSHLRGATTLCGVTCPNDGFRASV